MACTGRDAARSGGCVVRTQERVDSSILVGGIDAATFSRFRQAWIRLNAAGAWARAATPSDLVVQSRRLQPEFVAISEAWLRQAGLDLLTQLSVVESVSVLVCGENLGALTVARGFSRGLR